MAQILRYDKHTLIEGLSAAVAVAEGDLCYVDSAGVIRKADLSAASGTGELSAVGVAARTVVAADITAGGERAKVTLYTRGVVRLDAVGGTEAAGMRVFASPDTAGAWCVVSEVDTDEDVIQMVGRIIRITPTIDVIFDTGLGAFTSREATAGDANMVFE